jgi:hypothetical protein
MWSSLQDP